MDRPKRDIKRVDYQRLDNYGMEDMDFSVDQEDESFFSEEEEQCSVDMSDNEELDFFNMSETDFDAHVEKAISDGNEEKLAQLLEMKERRCQQLQRQLKEQERLKKEEDKAKKKRLREMQEKFKKLQKAETSLNKSLANSANSTPAGSPEKTPKKKRTVRSTLAKSPKAQVRKTCKKQTQSRRGLDPHASREKKGEIISQSIPKKDNDIYINSAVNLPEGNKLDHVNELLSRAVNVNELVSHAKDSQFNLEVLKAGKITQSSAMGGFATNNGGMYRRECRDEEQLNRNVETAEGKQQLVNSLENVLQADNAQQLQLIELLRELKELKIKATTDEQKKQEGEKTTKPSEEEKEDNKIAEGKKKPVSGKLAKPDEIDIKKPVKFAHEKLDPRHSKERIFDQLNFQLLVAGELELATREEASLEEKDARVRIAKTICYHKLYLTDEDLRRGYDIVMKQVEQGVQSWGPQLAEELHQLLDYRSNVISRERMKEMELKMLDNKNKAKKDDKKSEENKGDETTEEGGDFKPIFCMDYNKGECTFKKSHGGKWRGKKVTKWHICKGCLKNSELLPHPETECPNKKA